MADARAEFRILTHAYIDFVLVNHRRGDDVVLGPAAALFEFGGLGIAVELPDRLAALCLEAAEPAITASKNNLALAIDQRVGRTGPLPEHNLAARRIVLPGNLAGFLVEG